MSNFEIEGLRFERDFPDAFVDRFDEIQDLRRNYYQNVFQRSPEEVEHFVNHLTPENWSDPNNSIGTTARSGQSRGFPIVSAAFNAHTNSLVGYMYAARNVSSKLEPVLNRLHVPLKISEHVGDLERNKKIRFKRDYVWGSEYVHTDKIKGLVPILGALTLGTYRRSELRTTWYPWDEETELKSRLTEWGYKWDQGKPTPIEGENGFGIGSKPTKQERWVAPSVHTVLDNILDIKGAVAALGSAQRTLENL